jgi:hypothetical protein
MKICRDTRNLVTKVNTFILKKKKSKVMETMDSEPNIKILNKDGVQLCPFMTFPHLSHSHPGSGSNKTLFIKARA